MPRSPLLIETQLSISGLGGQTTAALQEHLLTETMGVQVEGATFPYGAILLRPHIVIDGAAIAREPKSHTLALDVTSQAADLDQIIAKVVLSVW